MPASDPPARADDDFAPRPLEQALDAGYTVSGFIVQRVIDRSRRAINHAARRLTDNQAVMLRVYSAELCEVAGRVQRFVEQQRVLRTTAIPHTPRVFDVGRLPDGRVWLATESLRGASLVERIRSQALSKPEADGILADAAHALVAAHAHAIVHGDLQLEDLFLHEPPDGEPQTYLLDLGVSYLLGAGSALGAHSRGERPEAEDVRGLGRIAFRLSIGRELDEAGDLAPQPAGARRFQNLDAEKEQLLLAMLAPEPRMRPTAAETRRQLVEHEDDRATRPRGVQRYPDACPRGGRSPRGGGHSPATAAGPVADEASERGPRACAADADLLPGRERSAARAGAPRLVADPRPAGSVRAPADSPSTPAATSARLCRPHRSSVAPGRSCRVALAARARVRGPARSRPRRWQGASTRARDRRRSKDPAPTQVRVTAPGATPYTRSLKVEQGQTLRVAVRSRSSAGARTSTIWSIPFGRGGAR